MQNSTRLERRLFHPPKTIDTAIKWELEYTRTATWTKNHGIKLFEILVRQFPNEMNIKRQEALCAIKRYFGSVFTDEFIIKKCAEWNYFII